MSTTSFPQKGPQPEIIRESNGHKGLSLSKPEHPVTVITEQTANAPGTCLGRGMPRARVIMVDAQEIDRTDYAVPVLATTYGFGLAAERALVLLTFG